MPGYNTTYVYDGAGNRLVKNDGGALTTYSYGSGNRLLSEVTGSAVTTYSYDANGNQTLINAGGALTTYAWDGENRLSQVTQPDGSSESHEYSHQGLRRKKQVTDASGAITTTTYFVWDGQSPVQERDELNRVLAQYTWAPETWDGVWSGGELMDVLLLERRASTPGDMAGGVSRYHGEDPSYNTRLLIEPGGSVSDRFSYKAFGEVWNHLGDGMTPLLFGGALGYWFDALRRMPVRNRVYDSITGRWISVDPIGFYGGDWNLFGYVGNMPVNWIDPDGLMPTPPPAPAPTPPPMQEENNCCYIRRIVFWFASGRDTSLGVDEAANKLRAKGYTVQVVWDGTAQQLSAANHVKCLAGLYIGAHGRCTRSYNGHVIANQQGQGGKNANIVLDPRSKQRKISKDKIAWTALDPSSQKTFQRLWIHACVALAAGGSPPSGTTKYLRSVYSQVLGVDTNKVGMQPPDKTGHTYGPSQIPTSVKLFEGGFYKFVPKSR